MSAGNRILGASYLVRRHISSGKLFDSIAVVQRLEAQGVPSKQAKAIAAAITEVSQSFVSKAEMAKIQMLQEAKSSKFKSEAESSQEHQFFMQQHAIKKLQADLEKLEGELGHENEKYRTDLEKKLDKMRNKLRYEGERAIGEVDQEIDALGAQMDAAKFEVIKCCINTFACISAVSLAVSFLK